MSGQKCFVGKSVGSVGNGQVRAEQVIGTAPNMLAWRCHLTTDLCHQAMCHDLGSFHNHQAYSGKWSAFSNLGEGKHCH